MKNNLGDYEEFDNDSGNEELDKLNAINETSDETSSEEEVFPIHSAESESESDANVDENETSLSENESPAISESDISDKEDDLPDPKAWGKKKKYFYNADHINDKNDYLKEEDEEAAAMEEEEARAIQNRMLSEIANADLSIDLLSDIIAEKKKEKHVTEGEKIELDLSKMNDQEKLKLLKRECPELFDYIDDYKKYMICVRDELLPTLEIFEKKNPHNLKICEFLQLYHQIIMNYCTNILFFMTLKTHNSNLKSHPVNKWLSQFKNLLVETETVYTKFIKSHLISLKNPNKLNKLFENQFAEAKIKDKKLDLNNVSSINGDSNLDMSDDGSENLIDESEEAMSVEDENDDESKTKRPITYQIAKNKGLTPRRKKELRNPRVKHRMKFRKAKIRRKGQIREVRKELQKYSGEISGIKATVTKSIKFKI